MDKDNVFNVDKENSNILSGGYALDSDSMATQRQNETVLEGRPNIKNLFVNQDDPNLYVGDTAQNQADTQEDISQYLDDSLDINTAATQLAQFASNCGILLSATHVRQILCAMQASRLVVFKGDSKLCEQLCFALSKYFGTEEFVQTQANQAILQATKHSHLLHILTFCNLEQNLDSILPFARYADSPYSQCATVTLNDQEFVIPQNLWCIAVANQLPQQLLDTAATIEVVCQKSTSSRNSVEHKTVTYHQFVKLADDCEQSFEVDEQLWKKVDKLEEYTVQKINSAFAVSNKQWRRMEKFASCFQALQGLQAEAVDNAAASVLMPQICVQAVQSASQLLQAVEKAFDASCCSACLNAVKVFASAQKVMGGRS